MVMTSPVEIWGTFIFLLLYVCIALFGLLLFNLVFFDKNKKVATLFNRYAIITCCIFPYLNVTDDFFSQSQESVKSILIMCFMSIIPVIMTFYYIRYDENV